MQAVPMQNQDTRFLKLQKWLQSYPELQIQAITPIQNDASFRRYFRVKSASQNYLVMDAPPEREPLTPFIHVSELLKQSNILVPTLYKITEPEGFILLTDFGDNILFRKLNTDNVNQYYQQAMQILKNFHSIPTESLAKFYETKIFQEFALFFDWYIPHYAKHELTNEEKKLLADVFQLLYQNVCEQPQGFIHLDFHSRNLLITQENDLAVIDFQDAMIGPVTYDLVSLLKDCYIDWPFENIYAWVSDYYQMLKNQLPARTDLQTFIKWFDLTGLQRHIKVLGIFSRLAIRDNKPDYLKNFPRIYRYILGVCERYAELNKFKKFFTSVMNVTEC